MRTFKTTVNALLLVTSVIVFGGNIGRADEVAAQVTAEFARIADKADEIGLAAHAQYTRSWEISRDPNRSYFFLPDQTTAKPLPPAEPGKDRLVAAWLRAFTKARKQRAELIFQRAIQHLEGKRSGLAYQLLHEVVREDPDHEVTRKALGYRNVNDVWRKPTGATKVTKSSLAHPTFRFRPGSYLRVDSEHFQITSRLSAKQSESIAAHLESLHSVWRQLFFEYWSSTAVLERAIQFGQTPKRSLRRHKVVIFANRAEYVQSLTPLEPRIAITTGLYLDHKRTAYFYQPEDGDLRTLYHEVTHQLFQETGQHPLNIGSKGDAWSVEAVSLYMESLVDHGQYATVGGVEASRLQFARYNVLNGGVYVPLADLTKIGREQLQSDPNIRQVYSQAAGLAHFFMHHKNVDAAYAYRSGFVGYLKSIYAGRNSVDSLATVTNTSLNVLDEQYQGFLDVTDAELEAIPAKARKSIRNLSLGKTSVTDKSLLKCLPEMESLEWLNLSYTPATDRAVSAIQSGHMRELNLERTEVTDGAMQQIGKLSKLQELDLSNTGVTDAGVGKLASLTDLKILWLTSCNITDASIESLSRLKALEYLNINHTKLSPAGWEKLRSRLPNLKVEE